MLFGSIILIAFIQMLVVFAVDVLENGTAIAKIEWKSPPLGDTNFTYIIHKAFNSTLHKREIITTNFVETIQSGYPGGGHFEAVIRQADFSLASSLLLNYYFMETKDFDRCVATQYCNYLPACSCIGATNCNKQCQVDTRKSYSLLIYNANSIEITTSGVVREYKCPKGTSGATGTCEECSAGRYSSKSGSLYCSTCPSGQISLSSVSAFCVDNPTIGYAPPPTPPNPGTLSLPTTSSSSRYSVPLIGGIIGGIGGIVLLGICYRVYRNKSRDGQITDEEQIGPYETFADQEQDLRNKAVENSPK